MTTKAEWKRRALEAERSLVLGPPPTFDTLTVCWSARTVEFHGRTIAAPGEQDYLVIPITSDVHAMMRTGWYPA